MKKIVRLVRNLLLFTFLFLTFGILFIYFQKDRIIQYAVQQLNPYLQGKLYVEQIDFAFLRTFPDITLTFYRVYFTSTHPLFQGDTLFRIHYLETRFDLVDVLLHRNYVLKKVIGHTGSIRIQEKKGVWSPATIFREDTTARAASPFVLHLNQVIFNYIQVHFQTEANLSRFSVTLDTFHLTGKMTEEQFQANLFTRGRNLEWGFKGKKITPIKRFHLDGTITRYEELYKIEELRYRGDGLFLDGSGRVSSSFVSLSLRSSTSSLKQYLSTLREFFTLPSIAYDVDGTIEIQAGVEGPITPTRLPELNVTGSISNGTLTYQGHQLHDIHFQAQVHFPLSSPQDFRLRISDFRCQWQHHTLNASMELYNLLHPTLFLSLQGKLYLPLLQPFLPDSHLLLQDGILTFQLESKKSRSFSGLADLNLMGQVTIDSLRGTYYAIPLSIPRSQLLFVTHALHIKDLELHLPKHQFRCSGVVANYAPLLTSSFAAFDSLSAHSLPQLNLLVSASSIDLDTLKQLYDYFQQQRRQSLQTTSLSELPHPSDTSAVSPFPGKIRFTVQVDHFYWDCFRADFTYLKGSYENDSLTIDTCFLHTLKGEVSLKGTYAYSDVVLTLTTREIDIRSFFDCFRELGEQLGIGPHIHGHLEVQVVTHFKIRGDTIDYTSLEAEGTASARQLELYQYAPLYKFSKFIQLKDLETARFEDMRTSFWIRNGWFHFSKMRVKVNRYEFYIEGRQHYQGELDYSVQLILPFFTKGTKGDRSQIEEFIVEDRETSRPSLFIRVTGTLDSPQFKLDKSALRTKWEHDLWKERQEIHSRMKRFFKEELGMQDTTTAESLIEEE